MFEAVANASKINGIGIVASGNTPVNKNGKTDNAEATGKPSKNKASEKHISGIFK
jgi:hypothetical protein